MTRPVIAAIGMLAASLAAGQTADELIAKNFEARGGLENLKAVQTMRLTGTMKAGRDSLPSVLELKRPNKSRWEFTLDGQTAVEAFDGEGGWTWIPFAGQTEPQPMSEEESLDAELNAAEGKRRRKFSRLVPSAGLEPAWVAPYAPQTYVSTNSTTTALGATSSPERRREPAKIGRARSPAGSSGSP